MPHPQVIFKDVFNWIAKRTEWSPDRENAVVIAEGLIDGKVVARSEKRPARKKSGIHLEMDSMNIALIADGSDFVPIRARIIDQYGRTKSQATDLVYFTVEGEGRLIGDMQTQANPFDAQFGTATAFVQTTTTAGRIKVRA